MFPVAPYEDVNREERHYCALLMHATLASATFRNRVVTLLNERTKAKLDERNLQVFLEASVLRDYWHALGRPPSNPEVRERRRQVVVEALGTQGLGESLMEEALFWTTAEKRIAWYPGVWRYKDILAARLGQQVSTHLSTLRTAFKAIPDLLFLSPGNAVYIEAKLESGEGKDGRGYSQFENLRQIALLTESLVPAFHGAVVDCALLTRSPAPTRPFDMATLLWEEVRPLEKDRLDPFTKSGLGTASKKAPKSRG